MNLHVLTKKLTGSTSSQLVSLRSTFLSISAGIHSGKELNMRANWRNATSGNPTREEELSRYGLRDRQRSKFITTLWQAKSMCQSTLKILKRMLHHSTLVSEEIHFGKEPSTNLHVQIKKLIGSTYSQLVSLKSISPSIYTNVAMASWMQTVDLEDQGLLLNFPCQLRSLQDTDRQPVKDKRSHILLGIADQV